MSKNETSPWTTSKRSTDYVCPEHIAYIVPDNVNNRTKISFVGGKEIVVNNSIDAVLKFLKVYSVSGK